MVQADGDVALKAANATFDALPLGSRTQGRDSFISWPPAPDNGRTKGSVFMRRVAWHAGSAAHPRRQVATPPPGSLSDMPPRVTTFQRGDSELSLLKRADTALDLAKQRGRNPVAADTPT